MRSMFMVCSALLLVSAGCATLPVFVPPAGVAVIAHRGASHDAPENTLAALEALAKHDSGARKELEAIAKNDGALYPKRAQEGAAKILGQLASGAGSCPFDGLSPNGPKKPK